MWAMNHWKPMIKRQSMRVLLLTLLLLGSMTSKANPAIQSYLERLEGYGLSGIVLVARGDEIVVHEALGYADLALNRPNTTDTYFDYASITKTFTGAATLVAAQQGHLFTEDLLSKYLGSMPGKKALATIHRLATHKAGLVILGFEGLDGSSREAYIQSIKSAPIESRPGIEYRYTNAGSSLLAAVLEYATGQPWSVFIQVNLFAPAGMKAKFDPELDVSDLYIATGYAGLPPVTEQGLETDYS